MAVEYPGEIEYSDEDPGNVFDISTPIWRISTHLHSADVGLPAIEWKEIHTIYEGDDEERAMRTVWNEIATAERPMSIYIDRMGDRLQIVEIV